MNKTGAQYLSVGQKNKKLQTVLHQSSKSDLRTKPSTTIQYLEGVLDQLYNAVPSIDTPTDKQRQLYTKGQLNTLPKHTKTQLDLQQSVDKLTDAWRQLVPSVSDMKYKVQKKLFDFQRKLPKITDRATDKIQKKVNRIKAKLGEVAGDTRKQVSQRLPLVRQGLIGAGIGGGIGYTLGLLGDKSLAGTMARTWLGVVVGGLTPWLFNKIRDRIR